MNFWDYYHLPGRLVGVGYCGQGYGARDRGEKPVTTPATQPDNPWCTRGSANFFLTAVTSGLAETNHAVILYLWADQMVKAARQVMDR
jgi:hypothetical protein